MQSSQAHSGTPAHSVPGHHAAAVLHSATAVEPQAGALLKHELQLLYMYLHGHHCRGTVSSCSTWVLVHGWPYHRSSHHIFAA